MPFLSPFVLPHQANYLSQVYAQKDLLTTASVSQHQLYGTPFPNTFMIAPSLCYILRVQYVEDTFVSFPVFKVAEKRAELTSAFCGAIQVFH